MNNHFAHSAASVTDAASGLAPTCGVRPGPALHPGMRESAWLP